MKISLSPEIRKLMILLLAVDVGFALLHVSLQLGFVSNRLYSIEVDRSYPEFFQYTKELWIAMLLVMLATNSHRLLHLSWSALFVYFLLDDSMQIHEKMGALISERLGFQPMLGLRAVDFGELAVSAIAGIAILPSIAIAHFKATHIARKVSKNLFFLTVGLAFYGVVIDMIHVVVPYGSRIFGLIEDAGEMMIMSCILAYAFSLKPTRDTDSLEQRD